MPPEHRESEGRLLFCPFCRECFEGATVCPEHDLALVPFTDLPRQAHEREVRWDEPVAPWEVRFGRLEIALGIVLAFVGFFAVPLVTGTFDDRPIVWTALEAGTSRAPNLWTVPFVAALFAVFLHRRRTPQHMRGARLAGIMLSVAPVASLAYSLRNIERGTEDLHGALVLEWGPAVWVVVASSALLLVGSLRFGGRVAPPAPPHGSEPADAAPRIDTGRAAKPRSRRR